MFKCMSKVVQDPRYVGKEMTTDTSYFCLVIWSCSSNFSASSWYIHSHSSLAFSLWEVKMQQCCSPALSDSCHHLGSWPVNLQLPEPLLVQVVDVQWFTSLVQDLLLLLSLCLPLATALFCLQTSRRNQDPPSGYFKKMHPGAQCAHQLLHVPSEMEAGEGLLFLGIIFGSPLGFLLFLTSSLILDLRR